MYIKNKRGQSTVEYILLVTAVIAAMVAFSVGKNSLLQNNYNQILNQSMASWSDKATALSDSESGSNVAGNSTPPISLDITNGVGN